jgi:hypothetical protein
MLDVSEFNVIALISFITSPLQGFTETHLVNRFDGLRPSLTNIALSGRVHANVVALGNSIVT